MLSYALLSLSLIAVRHAPAGTQLHIRLNHPIGTYSTKSGTPVSAVLIAPVTSIGGDILIPAGSLLNGSVRRVQKVGYGVAHETAALDLEFSDISMPDGRSFPLETRVADVDNGRERVTEDGMIRGMRMTSSPAYRASGYIRSALAIALHARLEFWVAKMLIMQVPESEIFYPAGAELTLWLTQPLATSAQANAAPALTSDERSSLHQQFTALPYRTYTPANRPSDLLNLVFIGSREEIAAAFTAAGWTETHVSNWRSWANGVRAVITNQGYHAAPMSKLLVNDEAPEMLWQKGLNNMAKRHHIRMWRQTIEVNGEEVWVGAATRDIDFAYLRPGQAVTHRIEENIDNERDKIANDLAFTTCAAAVDLWDRPGAPTFARNSTGDPMSTDGRVAIIKTSSCDSPRTVPPPESLQVHGNYFQRLVRRQILSYRSDFYRKNMYWRAYEGLRWSVSAVRNRHPQPMEFKPTQGAPDSLLARAKNSSWIR